ncbi:PilZ domain-containing protein [Sphingomonas qomolangmaensis]|uniref:PilZ domain-containing protein n=1 Tax=Sphingomonas qomolangmaensis TaxID=2918765 RepID=A0ABY5LCN1_9SPHN|nr:PilZ domain-containing protein [Sphingomonas qomolangmaensis]UUL83597.1 PilZ domain-containing protein [Sphingomonas qomolangmaensis]
MSSAVSYADQREVERDLVDYRARGFGPDARPLSLQIVNISPHGMMARLETNYVAGQRIRVTLPVIGVMVAEIRWALGGRIGCSFDVAIDRASYYELLATMLKR